MSRQLLESGNPAVDMLLFANMVEAYNRLPEDEKASVRRLALLRVARSADLEIHVTGWLGVEAHAGSRPTAPESERLTLDRVQCFYGAEEEADTACTLPS